MTLIPEYIIIMTWALAAVIILSIIIAILFRLYIMFIYNEKEKIRDRANEYQHQLDYAKTHLYNIKREIEELEAKKETLK